jgi:3-phenylpropionate/trans-cinnamate dioxygenase ferredoxin subunit
LSQTTWKALFPLADLTEGQLKGCIVDGRDVLVCHTKEGVFAVDNICTHAFARLSEGRLRGFRLICPLHGASFDVRTGRVLGPPALTPLALHEVRVTDGIVEVLLGAAPTSG